MRFCGHPKLRTACVEYKYRKFRLMAANRKFHDLNMPPERLLRNPLPRTHGRSACVRAARRQRERERDGR